MSEVLDHAAIGTLEQIRQELERLNEREERADEWGATDDATRVRWPVQPGGPNFVDYNARGTFKSLMIINDSGASVFIGLAPASGQTGRQLLTLATGRFIVLPVRGSVVSIGAAAAGSVALIPFSVTMPAAGGDI